MERLNKNFLWLAGANITSSIFATALFIYLARALEAGSFGSFSYASTLIFYLFNFIDLGLSTYGARESAKDNPRARELVSNIVSFRLIISTGLFILFTLATVLSCNTPVMKFLMIETALMLFISGLASEWAFQGLEKMHMVFISLSFTTFLQFSLSFIFIKGPGDLLKVPAINFIASLPIIALFLQRLKFNFRFRTLEYKTIKTYLSSSINIWGISVLAQAYNVLDIVMLGFFRQLQEVGCFTVARRAVGGLTLLMIFLANAVLPRLSSSFGKDQDEFRRATRKFLKLSALAAVFIFTPLAIFSKELIMLTVGPDYLSADMPIKIMVIAVMLISCNLPYSTGLIAAGMERVVLKQAGASAALSVISNFILIPKYGMIGASISFLSAEALALAWILTVYRRRIGKL